MVKRNFSLCFFFFSNQTKIIVAEIIHDICKPIMLERRPAWDVVIHQGDPGDT